VVAHELARTMDLFTTSLKLAGAAVPADRVIDGVDLTPILFGAGPSHHEFFCYYRGTQLYALRKGSFKAHFITRSAYGSDAPVSHNPPLLFDLGHDAGEQFNVAASHPDLLADVAKEVERHRATITPVKCQLEEDGTNGK
jgi:arylsulfatase A-like enzyme